MKIGLVGTLFGDRMEKFANNVPEAVLAETLRRNGYEVLTFPMSEFPKKSVDVMHANHFGDATYYLSLVKSSPLVFTPHNGFLICDFDIRESVLDRVWRPLVFRRADVVVATSRLEAQILQRDYGIKPKKIVIIPNGIEADSSSDRRLSGFANAADRIRLLAIGQLETFKGYRYLLESMAQIVPHYPDVELVIVTHNPRLLSEYEHFCQEQHLEGHVHIEGAKTSDELWQYYSSCDIFVQPSLVENFSTTVLEAMACGVAVVATRVGGVAEQLGQTGILVTPGDSQELFEAIAFLIKHPEFRRDLGKQARLRCQRLYSSDRFMSSYIDAYELAKESFESRRGSASIPPWLSRALLLAYRHRGRVTAKLWKRSLNHHIDGIQ